MLRIRTALFIVPLLLPFPAFAQGAAIPTLALPALSEDCRAWSAEQLTRNPGEAELRCRYGIVGPGRFGLLSYADVPVYQPVTPMPGTHMVGVPGHAKPAVGESYEEWEWRMLRTDFGAEAEKTYRGVEVLDPIVASRILTLEARLAEEGIRATRRETWRSPIRQAHLFQQGRSRPGPLATATLTSWHSQVDELGRPAGRAVDYDVPWSHMPRFHEIAAQVGLESFGADSNDPGHVFLPGTEQLPAAEVAILRTLRRVPEVTLATGRPVDDLALLDRVDLRDRSSQFVGDTFLPYPRVKLAGATLRPEPVRVRASGGEPLEHVSTVGATLSPQP
jgi:hypothetical protein